MFKEIKHWKRKCVLLFLFTFIVNLPLLILRQYVDSEADSFVTELSFEKSGRLARTLLIVTYQIRQDVENDRKDKLSLSRSNILRWHQFQ